MNLRKNFTTLEPGLYTNSSQRSVRILSFEMVEEEQGAGKPSTKKPRYLGELLRLNGEVETQQHFEADGTLWDPLHRGVSSVQDLVELVRLDSVAA